MAKKRKSRGGRSRPISRYKYRRSPLVLRIAESTRAELAAAAKENGITLSRVAEGYLVYAIRAAARGEFRLRSRVELRELAVADATIESEA
jgi:hypothetical protein